MRITIGVKIFGIALGLLLLMGAAAVLSLRMSRTVDGQLAVVDHNYFPAFSTLAQANIATLRESAVFRRLLLAMDPHEQGSDGELQELQGRVAKAAQDYDATLAEARRNINEQITDPLDFDDNVALARLDTRLEFLQEEHEQYKKLVGDMLAAVRANRQEDAQRLLPRLDKWRDDFDRRMDAARGDMHKIASNAIDGTRAYQRKVVQIGLGLLLIAGLLGVTLAAAVTAGMVRPVRRLLAGTAAVEKGALDTVVPVTSRDEIGRLTEAFNNMVGELRVKEQIRETFGKYVDPRIVSGLIDRPELTDPKGARREMTILFCDMQGFTSFSEGMTPAGLVTVLNRYLSLVSEPVLRQGGIVDKYIGDAVMAFWGPPFTGRDDHARLACLAAIDQLASVPAFQAELPDLLGIRRGFPKIALRVGIATGEVVVGSIGSEQTRNYTVIGDTVNVASRLEGVNKSYGTRILINEATRRLAGEAVEAREIDAVRVVGKSEPERIFELLGRKGLVESDLLELRDTYEAALAAYRRQEWDGAANGFRTCLAIAPEDGAGKTMLERIAHFRDVPPEPDWAGVWSMTVK